MCVRFVYANYKDILLPQLGVKGRSHIQTPLVKGFHIIALVPSTSTLLLFGDSSNGFGTLLVTLYTVEL